MGQGVILAPMLAKPASTYPTAILVSQDTILTQVLAPLVWATALPAPTPQHVFLVMLTTTTKPQPKLAVSVKILFRLACNALIQLA
jgi:hypothetical protein